MLLGIVAVVRGHVWAKCYNFAERVPRLFRMGEVNTGDVFVVRVSLWLRKISTTTLIDAYHLQEILISLHRCRILCGLLYVESN